MSIRNLMNYLQNVLLIGATAAIVLAFLELIAQFAGFSLIREIYPPGRIIELAAALLVLVIAITLREIRDELRGRTALDENRRKD